VCEKIIFVKLFRIEPFYRKQGYSKRIITSLCDKYNNKSIHLECWPTLWPFYKKLGFKKVCNTVDGYFEVYFNPNK
jgi:predicted GNAT family N-acyltransferase